MKKMCKIIIFRVFVWLIFFIFMVQGIGPLPLSHAQTSMPIEGSGVQGLRLGLTPMFTPVLLKGIKIFPSNPFQFEFMVGAGNTVVQGDLLKKESSRLVKYFLTSLTVPDADLWVNLSPDEPDRIIPEQFGQTEMGRDLLAQDYRLKQITASLMYPEDELGEEFWDQVYEQVYQEYGTMNIPIDMLNKVWIVPEKAVVYENVEMNTAFVLESRLRVMLEEDYVGEGLAPSRITGRRKARPYSNSNKISTAVIRKIIIPAIEREVNHGQGFSKLRQIYHSLILATWFKRNLKKSILSQIYVGQNKITGVDIHDKQAKDKLYHQYLKAFQKGAYNYIKEDYDPVTQQIVPRKYFSGGIELAMLSSGKKVFEALDAAMQVTKEISDQLLKEITGKTASFKVPVKILPESGKDTKGTNLGIFTAKKQKKFRNIINPKKVKTAEDLVRIIEQIKKDNIPKERNYSKYSRVLITGISILSHELYQPYLNDLARIKLNELNTLEIDIQESDFNWTKDMLHRLQVLANFIPTIENPNEDLFIDVFAGFTDEQIKILANSGDFLDLQLSKNCVHQCLFCNVSKNTIQGAPRHMPFSLAIKIAKRIRREGQSNVSLYRKSDPLHYHDKVINATYGDVARHLIPLGYYLSTITHGDTGVLGEENMREIVKRFPPSLWGLEFSLNAYYANVKRYAIKKVNGEIDAAEDDEVRQKLVKPYVDNFASLLVELIPQVEVDIRDLFYGKKVEKILEGAGLQFALSVVKEMQSVQNKIWEDVGKIVFEKTGKYIPVKHDFEFTSGIRFTYDMVWESDAVSFLKELGVKEDIIRGINKSTQRGLDDRTEGENFVLQINTNGSLSLRVAEAEDLRFRTFEEMFTSADAEGFRSFLEVIKIVLKTNSFKFDKQMDAKVLRKDVSKGVLKKLFKNALNSSEDIEKFLINRSYLVKGSTLQTFHYFEVLFGFFYSKEDMLADLKNKKFEDMFEKLKKVPFPIGVDFFVKFKQKQFLDRYSYRIIKDQHPRYPRNINQSVRHFNLSKNVFSSLRENNPLEIEYEKLERPSFIDESNQTAFYDSALLADGLNEKFGGIDLTADSLPLQARGEGIEFKFPSNSNIPCFDDDNDGTCDRIDVEGLATMSITGFRPEFFEIVPVNSVSGWLGISVQRPTIPDLSL